MAIKSIVEFSLPDDLGWMCNDEISDYIDTWMNKTSKVVLVDGKIQNDIWQVAKAELMDNIYYIIKRYQ